MAVIQLENVTFTYDTQTTVLNGLNYSFDAGKIYAVTGRSGAGKTTLLSLLSGLASPTGGSIYYQNKDIEGIDKYDYRSKNVGVVFQSFNLIYNLSAVENIVLSMDIASAAPSAGSVPAHNSSKRQREFSSALLRMEIIFFI